MKRLSNNMPDTKTVIVHSAKKAIGDLNDKYKQMQEWQGGMDRQVVRRTLKAQQQASPDLQSHLTQNAMPASFSVRTAMAKKLGIDGYLGTPEQDSLIMLAITNRGQKENEQQRTGLEMAHRDREFGLKEKELELKREQALASKAPTADEVADAIINKYKTQ